MLAGIGTAGLAFTAGCLSADDQVMEHYTRGYELFNAAEGLNSEDELEDALSLYEQSENEFDSAKSAAGNDTVEEYCDEARELASIEVAATEAEIRSIEREEEEEEEEDDDSRYETTDVSDYVDYIGRSSRARRREMLEMRSPSSVELRSRLPF